MRGLWLSVVGLAFLGLPAASSEESDECSRGQIVGNWYVHGIASNCEWMVAFVVKKVMPCTITSQAEGTVMIATNCTTDYGPMEVEMEFTKQTDGMYLHKSEWGDKIIEKRKTDCKTYIMSSIRDLKENDGKFCKFVSLYGRELSMAPSVKQSFVEFCMERQMGREQIFLLEGKDASTKST